MQDSSMVNACSAQPARALMRVWQSRRLACNHWDRGSPIKRYHHRPGTLLLLLCPLWKCLALAVVVETKRRAEGGGRHG
jgi:hypothetical protein